MQSLEALWEREAVSSARYLLGSEDQQVKDAMELQETLRPRGKYSYIQVAQDILTKYDILVSLSYPLPNDTPPGRNLAGAIKNQQIESAKVGLLSKRVHGVYYGQTLQDDCDQKVMFELLKDGRLRAVTEGLIMAAQDGVIHTATYRNRILKMPLARRAEYGQLKLWAISWLSAVSTNMDSSKNAMTECYTNWCGV